MRVEEEEEEEADGAGTTKAWRLPRPTKASKRRRAVPLLACGGDCCMMAVGWAGVAAATATGTGCVLPGCVWVRGESV